MLILGVARAENPAWPIRGPLPEDRKPEMLAFLRGRNDKIEDLRGLKHTAGFSSRNLQRFTEQETKNQKPPEDRVEFSMLF